MTEQNNPPEVWYYHRRKTDILPEGADHKQGGEEHPHRATESRRHSDKTRSGQEESEDGSGDDESHNKDDDDDDKEGGGKQKKMSPEKKRKFIIIAVIIGIILIISGVLYWLYARQYETTDDAFIDGHVSQVSSRISGQIASLLIVDNEHVKAGQLLTEIDPRDYQMRVDQTKAQYSQAVAQVALQQAGIGQAEANVGVAKAQVFQADSDLKRFKDVDPKAITRQQLDTAIANADSAHAKLRAAEEQVEASKAQEGAARAQVQIAQAELNNAELQLSYTKIIAPITGRVTRRTVEVGNVVSPSVPLLAIVSDELWVTANYKETQLNHMRVGDKVRIKVDACPSAEFWGHVDSFQKGTGSEFSILPAENATGNYVKVVQRVPVKIVFDNTNDRDQYQLSPGLSVDPRVTVR